MSKKTNDRELEQDDDKQPVKRDDDRIPTDGNPGGSQIKNLPGHGARRGDQGTAGGAQKK